MKLIYCLIILLCPFWNIAQTIKPLNIGDMVPDLEINNLYNYPVSSIRLSDLKGRLVILDFWSTWCGACIDCFPKMHQLQQEFGDKLMVILVNPFVHDTLKKVQSFFAKRKALTGLGVTLPYSLLQVSLPAYFPFKFIPHYVWIGKNGKILATTSQTEVTAENVRKALEENTEGLHDKTDLVDFSADIPLFVNGNGGKGDHFICRSVFTKYIEGIGNTSGVRKDEHGKITRFYMYNAQPLMLLRDAYPDELNCPPNRIAIESNNQFFPGPATGAENRFYTNAFCYDLVIPPTTINELRQYIREDMKRYLGVTVISEMRKMNCIVLRRINSMKPPGSPGGEPAMDIDRFSTRKYIRNEPMSIFTALLNNLPATKSIPVIDETNISGNIDVELPFDLYDLSPATLKTFLQKKGIEAVEMEKVITVSVIKDK